MCVCVYVLVNTKPRCLHCMSSLVVGQCLLLHLEFTDSILQHDPKNSPDSTPALELQMSTEHSSQLLLWVLVSNLTL